MIFSIRRFSSVLCLVYGTDQIDADLPPPCLQYLVMTENSEEVKVVIHKLSRMFESEFIPFVQRLTNAQTLGSFHSFMKVNLSWYIRMSENPSYFKFLLLSSLVRTIVSKTFVNKRCYCVAKVLSVCLIAAFYKSYVLLFREAEPLQSFGLYCKQLNRSLRSEGEISELPIHLQQQSMSMLRNLEDIDITNFNLTNFEKKILNDTLDLVAPEGNLPEDEVTTSTPYANDSPPNDESALRNDPVDLLAAIGNLPEDAVTTTTPTAAIDSDDELDDFDFPEPDDDSLGINGICVSCDRRCFKYIEAFKKDIREEII